MKYAIRLESKWTGESVYLGASYQTQHDAVKAAEKEVCTRCNRYSVIALPDEKQWQGRKEGWR